MSIPGISYSPSGVINAYATARDVLTARPNGAPALNAAVSSYKAELSSIGVLQSALSTLQTVTKGLTGDGLKLFSATTSTPNIVSATTSTTSLSGVFALSVTALAQSQVLTSASQASATAAIGTGAATTIKLDFGTTTGATFTADPAKASKSITIDASNNSLQGIAGAINKANIGVKAAVAFDGVGYKLSLTSASGAASSLRIGVTGDSAVAGVLAYDPAGVKNLTQTTAAQNSLVSVNGGAAISSATNSVSGAIAGTTLSLTGVGTTNLTIGADTAAITAKINAFVTAFNASKVTLKSTAASTPAIANTVNAIANGLTSSASATPNGLSGTPYNSLAQIGITTQKNGALALDSAKLQAAIVANPSAVTSLFSNATSTGVANKIVAQTTDLLKAGGTLSSEVTSVNKAIASIEKSTEALARTLTTQAQGLVNQYSRLGLALNTYQTTASILTTQFGALPRF